MEIVESGLVTMSVDPSSLYFVLVQGVWDSLMSGWLLMNGGPAHSEKPSGSRDNICSGGAGSPAAIFLLYETGDLCECMSAGESYVVVVVVVVVD